MTGRLPVHVKHPWLIAAVVCAAVPRPSSAQSILPVADEAGECAVRLREVVRLGGIGDPGTIGSRPEITRTTEGEYIVASVENRGELLVFDAEGVFRDRFGRGGDGPGEFRVPGRIRAGPDGSLRILDLGNRRITRLSADRRPLETVNVRSLHGLDFAAIALGERYAVSGFGQVDDVLSATTEIVDGGGQRSAGLGATPVESWMVNFFRAPVAVDGRGRVWTTRAGGYGFDAWDPSDGSEPVTRLVGDPEWFDPGPPRPGAPVTAPVPSVVIGLRVERGLLWTATWVADENWTPNPGAAPSPLDLDRLIDTILDVIDPAGGALIARTRRDEALRGTGDDALLFGVREEGGIARAVIFEPALAGPDCPPTNPPGR